MQFRTCITAMGGSAVLAAGLLASAPAAADSGDTDTTADVGPVTEHTMAEQNLSAAEAEELLADQVEASELEAELAEMLGDDFAGSYYDSDAGSLVVNVTEDVDTASLDTVADTDVTVETVAYGEPTLQAFTTDLDAADAPTDVVSWGPDVMSDALVVTVMEGAVADAEQFVAEAGIDPDAVEIEETDERPTLAQEIVGGLYYSTGAATCSVGHAVDGGFVTAGHCGGVGTSTGSPNGTVVESDFPGSDMAFVESSWTPTPYIDQHGQGPDVTVAGGQEAAIGADVCRSGGTTGVDCGQIQAKNQTVQYPEGTITGMTEANVCGEPGDSGGSWYSGPDNAAQAQGVTSGGIVGCPGSGPMYFQPLDPILSQYNLSLTTD